MNMFTIAAAVQADHRAYVMSLAEDRDVVLAAEDRAKLKRHGSNAEEAEGSSGEGVGAAKKQKGPTASNAETDESSGDGGAAANAEQVR